MPVNIKVAPKKLEYSNYHEYIYSDKWRFVRRQVFAQHDGRCFICKFKALYNHCHHVFYRPNIQDTKPDDCVLLCEHHHKMFHKYYRTTSSVSYGWQCLKNMKYKLHANISKRKWNKINKQSDRNKLSKEQKREMIMERNLQKRHKRNKKSKKRLQQVNPPQKSVYMQMREKGLVEKFVA